MKSITFDTKDQLEGLLAIINTAASPQQGYAVSDIEKALAVKLAGKEALEAIEGNAEAAPVLLVEDDHAEWLKARIEAQRWAVASDDIIRLVALVREPKKVKVAPVSDAANEAA